MGIFDFFGKKRKEKERIEREEKERIEREEKERIEREKEEKETKIKLKLTENLINGIILDLKKNPYKDKLSLKSSFWYFYFENGKKVLFSIKSHTKFEIIHDEYWWIITSPSLSNLLNQIFIQHKICIERKQKAYNQNFYAKSEVEPINHPLKDKYNLLVRQIKLRQTELEKYKNDVAKRKVLENELNNYKKAADKLKVKIFKEIK